ncbi:hypothetical protein [Natrinema salaciae]|uniref:Small CPxCG-related zinc finger protein n=1 Tax=Natrinema salaciae TaxID=1186196 RepID=A0A1H9A8G7_9EURY|nr:hypothetical protein [Natrinema salaciae]SEP72925.1 hypothetical protein SAMN04489841_0379 [Natrinema salaciae]
MSDDDSVPGDEPSAADELTLEADSIASNRSAIRRRPVQCPRCETPVALVVSYGPTTHEASPCGCPVSGGVLEGLESGSE